jgi:hypothetical protein
MFVIEQKVLLFVSWGVEACICWIELCKPEQQHIVHVHPRMLHFSTARKEEEKRDRTRN